MEDPWFAGKNGAGSQSLRWSGAVAPPRSILS